MDPNVTSLPLVVVRNPLRAAIKSPGRRADANVARRPGALLRWRQQLLPVVGFLPTTSSRKKSPAVAAT